jgi:hypothetical protein
MTRLAAIPVLACVIAWSAGSSAADAPAPTPETCLGIVSHSGQITAETAKPIGTDGCEFDNAHLSLTSSQSWSIEQLKLTRLDFASLARGAQIPPTLRVEAHGVRFSPVTPNKVTNYVLHVTIRPFDITLDYDAKSEPTVLKLAEFSMRGRNVGDLHLSGEIDGITPELIQAPNTIVDSAAGLRSLRIHLDNQGFVESYLVAPLAGALLQGSEDPEATVRQTQQSVIATMRGMLAPTATPPATVDALAAFVEDFPHPSKVLDVALSLPKPFGTVDLTRLQQGAVTLSDLLPAGALTASYAASTAEPATEKP